MAEHRADRDDQLVARAHERDEAALAELLDRHLHPAWRIALAATSSPDDAERAAVTGFCDGLDAAGRNPDPLRSVRTRIAAAVHAAARGVDADRSPRRAAMAHGGVDPVVAAFSTLPIASRTALWLTEVEGGEPAQVAPVLDVEPSVARSLAARASDALRDRIAADAAARADSDDCARARTLLAREARGRLGDDGRVRVRDHLEGCSACAVEVAALVNPRPALRGIVIDVPVTLGPAIMAAWAERAGRDRGPAGRRWDQRVAGVAAAAVLVLGLGGAAVLSHGSGGDETQFAAPVGTVVDDADTDAETADPLPAPVVLPTAPAAQAATAGRPTLALPADDAPRGKKPEPPAEAPAPPAAAPPAATPPAGSAPPAADDDASPLAPVTEALPGTVEVPGVVVVGVAPTKPEDPMLEVQIAGLPPVSIPNVPFLP